MTVGAHYNKLGSTGTASARGMHWHSFSECTPPAPPPSSLPPSCLATMVTCCTAWHAACCPPSKHDGETSLGGPHAYGDPARNVHNGAKNQMTIYCGSPCAAGSVSILPQRPDAAPTLWGIVLNRPADPCALKQLSEQVQAPMQPADTAGQTDRQADQRLLLLRRGACDNLRQPRPALTVASMCYCALLRTTSHYVPELLYLGMIHVSPMMVPYMLYGRKLVLVCPFHNHMLPTKGPVRV